VNSRIAGLAGAALLALAAACGETRKRPVPPALDLAFDTTQVIRSPGILTGTVNIVATGGLDFLQMTLYTGTGTILLDTLEGYVGESEVARPVQWLITPGLAPGTTLHFRVKARDFVDFETVDTLDFQTVP
jgi:hypothetical protein